MRIHLPQLYTEDNFF